MYVTERFKLPESVVEELHGMKQPEGYGLFSQVVFYRTYSRVKPDGTMENWADVVVRVIEGILSIRKDWYKKNHLKWDEDYWRIYSRRFAISMFKMHWLPPGRGLWAMGTDFIFERGSMALNNCGFVQLSRTLDNDLHWMMDALMCGVGVGFEPVRDDEFESYKPQGTFTFVIDDTRESWCDSVKALVGAHIYENRRLPVFDYSRIRPEGLPIKSFGGISSGPAPLKKLHENVIEFFEMYRLEEWYDSVILKTDLANAIGCCVVAGNVRRSAEIACGDINDDVFLDLKNYNKYPHRGALGWMSNNSAVLRRTKDFERLGEIAKRVVSNGEPGILNLMNFKYARIGKPMNGLRQDAAIGINPCLSRENVVMTPNGLKFFGDLKVGDLIWSKSGWTKVLKHWSSGVKQTYKYVTRAGNITCTSDHKVVSWGHKIPIGQVKVVDVLTGPNFHVRETLSANDIMAGLVVGDGTDKNGVIYLNIGVKDQDYYKSEVSHLIHGKKSKTRVNTKIMALPYTYARVVPPEYITGGVTKMCGFLRGLYSANGSIVHNRVTLKAASLAVIETVQAMLSGLGIKSYYTVNKSTVVTFTNGDYRCKQSYDLNIGTDDSVTLFSQLIGFIQRDKSIKLSKLVNKEWSCFDNGRSKGSYEVVEVIDTGKREVFDITVDNPSHTFWCQGLNISNCGEQPLENKELCTLVETLPTMCETPQEWIKACEFATLYASTVTLLPTHRESTNHVMQKNRRIGVGIIDFTGWKQTIGLNQVIKYLRQGYRQVRSVNKWLAAEAGIPESVRVTTMKPGGSVPKVAGKTAGAGHPNFHHTLRRMRLSAKSQMVKMLVDAGVPYEKDVVSVGTLVFEFPIIQGPAKPAEEVTVWEQVANIVVLQREWSDNAVSNTITFTPKWELVWSKPINTLDQKQKSEFEGFTGIKLTSTTQNEIVTRTHKIVIGSYNIDVYKYNPDHEEDQLEHVLAAHAASLKSLSMLPRTSKGVYAQMPEEGITEEEYNDRVSKLKPIDWSTLRNEIGEEEKYCSGDKCVL